MGISDFNEPGHHLTTHKTQLSKHTMEDNANDLTQLPTVYYKGIKYYELI